MVPEEDFATHAGKQIAKIFVGTPSHRSSHGLSHRLMDARPVGKWKGPQSAQPGFLVAWGLGA